MAVQLFGVQKQVIDTLPQRFERKHFILPRNIELACGFLRHTCLPTAEYPSEQINSLYFDTLDLDEYQRSDDGDFRKDKVRIRWYGKEDNPAARRTIYIELKSRQGFAGTKQRLKMVVSADTLALTNLHEGIVPRTFLTQTLARFGCFPEKLLLPVIRISYWRYRFCEIATGQKVSLDFHIRSTMIFPGKSPGIKELELPGGVLEIKGTSMELPDTLRPVQMLGLDWTRFSKYSACIDAHLERPGAEGCLSPSGRIVN
jgi:hypothetical protein